jgi:F-type H+-transporting ATPase subunit delta
MIRRFARPYAKALMEIQPSAAEGQKTLDELSQFEKARRSSPELAEIFGSPGIEQTVKQNVAGAIGKRLELSPFAVKVVEVLLKNNRLNDLGSILEAWQALIHRATGVAVAEVRSAHALDQAEQERLRRSLETRFGRKIELRLATDPGLLGGFVAQVESEVYDASVLGQITKIRQALSAR